jgi:hypothetical protein
MSYSIGLRIMRRNNAPFGTGANFKFIIDLVSFVVNWFCERIVHARIEEMLWE